MTNEELAIAIQNGDKELIGQLWEQCKGFVCQQALKWSRAWEQRTDFDTDDLIQSGFLALCEAVRGFQDDRGSFINFLSFHLKTEFSKVIGCQTKAQIKSPSYNAISLDAPAYGDSDSEITIGDTIPANDNSFEAVEDSIYQQQITGLVREAVDSIPENQSIGIDMYYLQGKPQKEVAERLNVSTARAQQVLKDGLKSLRKSTYIPALTEIFYNDQDFFKGSGFTSYKYSGMSSPERAVIYKEYIERIYSSKNWGGKVAMLINQLGYSIEKAQIVATIDSATA